MIDIISSLKTSNCHLWGASATPSSEMNRPETTFLIVLLSMFSRLTRQNVMKRERSIVASSMLHKRHYHQRNQSGNTSEAGAFSGQVSSCNSLEPRYCQCQHERTQSIFSTRPPVAQAHHPAAGRLSA